MARSIYIIADNQNIVESISNSGQRISDSLFCIVPFCQFSLRLLSLDILTQCYLSSVSCVLAALNLIRSCKDVKGAYTPQKLVSWTSVYLGKWAVQSFEEVVQLDKSSAESPHQSRFAN